MKTCGPWALSAVRTVLLLLLLLCVTYFPVPVSYADEELVKNGGFETGHLSDWITDAAVVRRSVDTAKQWEPSHSGEYSARIGKSGTVVEVHMSQAVLIPSKSTANFTAWYRVDKGASLIIFLKASDGSIIASWRVASTVSLRDEPWRSITYDLDLSFAGQSIAIEFVGQGDVSCSKQSHGQQSQPSQEGCPSGTLCFEETKRHKQSYTQTCYYAYPYVDDVSVTHSPAVYETAVSVTGLPRDLSTELLIDNTQAITIAGEEVKTLQFKIGETHKMSVQTYVYLDNRTRYYCASNSATVGSDGSVALSYIPQYYLSVSSPYGNATGGGWHDAGAMATFSTSGSVPGPTGSDYVLISWKITYMFDHWTGDCSSVNPSDSVQMDGPKTVIASWKNEKSSDYGLVFLVLAAMTIVVVSAVLIGGLGRRSGETWVCSTCGHHNPARNDFCGKCGTHVSDKTTVDY
jgi:hypothetical protein